jgi:hypothetical protein
MKFQGFSNRILKKMLLILLLTPWAMINCGGNGSAPVENISSQGINTTLGNLTVGSVAKIPFGSGGTSAITFQDLAGKEQFMLAFYSLSETVGNFNVMLDGSESLSDPGIHAHLIQENNMDAVNKSSDSPLEATSNFHEYLRKFESTLSNLPKPENTSLKSSMTQTTLRENFSVGDQVTLKVLSSLNSTDAYTTITAEIRYITPHFVVYRDVQASNVLSDADIQSLIDPFEANVENEYATFGKISDIDQDGKLRIVFSPVLNGIGGTAGIVTGFFFAGDLYPNNFAASNGGEYIYCHVPDENGTWGVAIPKVFYMSNTGPLCFPHELQHAINFNMKVFNHNGSPDPGPFNEGQSHFAEDLYNNFQNVSQENPSRVNLCFASELASFISGTSLGQRGCAYLFYRYLFEQADGGRFSSVANGKELMHKIHDTDLTGFASIEDVTGVKITSIASDFFIALYLSNTGLSNNSQYNFTGINLRSPQADNRGTILSGPHISEVNRFPASSSVTAMSSDYLLLNGESLMQSGSTLKLSPDFTMIPGATLIRIEDK